MQLLTDVVFETDNTFKLMQLFCKSIINSSGDNFSFSKFIKYDDFKLIIHKFIIETMGIFIAYTEYSDDTYDVYIKKLPRNLNGLFRSNKNELFINENVIKDIYDGKLEKFMTILHELNHFKVKYEILFGVINIDICRCVKELLLRDEDNHPFGRNFKNNSFSDDFYYDRNYRNYSEEVYVDMCSKKDFSLFMKIILITFYLDNENNMKKIDNFVDKYIKDDLVRYDNHIRYLTTSLSFNSNYLSFYEAFDVSVKYHPGWLKYPQISVEYYLDSDGYVKKKDILQLKDDLDKIDGIDTREYIEYLIKNIENKDLNQGRGRS